MSPAELNSAELNSVESNTAEPLLRVHGEVERPGEFTFARLAAIDAAHQIADVSQFDPKRQGIAVRLAGLLSAVGAKPTAAYIGLHAKADNFHASIPLAAVRDRAIVIYGLNGTGLPFSKGGPFRFYIPDHAACRTDDIDECANVKFIDEIEFTIERGFDNRPHDADEHAALHRGGANPGHGH